MFLRRRGIQPDVIDGMHLFDVLLEIMVAVDPAFNGEEGSSSGQRSSDRIVSVEPKPGQSTAQAMADMKAAGLL